MQSKITAKLLAQQSTKAKKERKSLYIWCSDLTNFGVYISKKGKTTYLVQRSLYGAKYDGTRKNRSQRITLGHASYLKLPEAQAKARTIIAQLANGEDVRTHLEQIAQEKTTQLIVQDTQAKDLLKDQIHAYLEKVPERRKWSASYLKETTRIFNADVIPILGSKPVAEISKKDLIELIENKEAKAPVVALHLYLRLTDLFDWLMRRDIISENFMLKIDQPKGANKRKRTLSDDEIKAFLYSCNLPKFNIITKKLETWQFGKLHQLAYLTMARLYEVTEMEWSELDLEHATWTIPDHKNKSKREHLIHLCPTAVKIIKSIPHGGSKYVFPSTKSPDKTLNAHDDAKQRIDELMCEYLSIGKAKLEPWIAHDLRRSAATKMQELGVDPMIIELCSNRKALRGTAPIYQRHEYLEQRKIAFHKLGSFVEELISVSERQLEAAE